MLSDDEARRLASIFDRPQFRRFTTGPCFADESELRDIEEMVGVPLPDDYRWYLRHIGLISVSTSHSVQPETGEDLMVHRIFGGTDQTKEPDTNSIAWRHNTLFDFHGVIAREEVAIATNVFGESFVMNLVTERVRYLGPGAGDLGVEGFTNFLGLIKATPATD